MKFTIETERNDLSADEVGDLLASLIEQTKEDGGTEQMDGSFRFETQYGAVFFSREE
jgi:hypothetical protein